MAEEKIILGIDPGSNILEIPRARRGINRPNIPLPNNAWSIWLKIELMRNAL